MRREEIRVELDRWLAKLEATPAHSMTFGELGPLDALVEQLPSQEGRRWLEEHWPAIQRVLVPPRRSGDGDRKTS